MLRFRFGPGANVTNLCFEGELNLSGRNSKLQKGGIITEIKIVIFNASQKNGLQFHAHFKQPQKTNYARILYRHGHSSWKQNVVLLKTIHSVFLFC